MASQLTDISGIGPQAAQLLASHGFKTIKSIAEADPVSLSQVQGFSAIRAGKTIESAKALLASPPTAKPAARKKSVAKKAPARRKTAAKAPAPTKGGDDKARRKLKKLKEKLKKKNLKKKDKKKLKKKIKELKG